MTPKTAMHCAKFASPPSQTSSQPHSGASPLATAETMCASAAVCVASAGGENSALGVV